MLRGATKDSGWGVCVCVGGGGVSTVFGAAVAAQSRPWMRWMTWMDEVRGLGLGGQAKGDEAGIKRRNIFGE